MASEQEKRAKRIAGRRPVRENDPAAKEIDRAIANARSNSVDLDGTQPMRQPLPLSGTSKPPQGHHAAPTSWVQSGLDGKSSLGHGHGEYTTVAEVNALIPNTTGNTTSYVSASDHRHTISSTPFIKYSDEERQRMLDDRAALEGALYSGELDAVERIVAQNVHNMLVLLMDYRDMDAYERERMLVDPDCEEWADDYKRMFGMGEYAQEDALTYIQRGKVRQDPHKGIAPIEGAPHA